MGWFVRPRVRWGGGRGKNALEDILCRLHPGSDDLLVALGPGRGVVGCRSCGGIAPLRRRRRLLVALHRPAHRPAHKGSAME